MKNFGTLHVAFVITGLALDDLVQLDRRCVVVFTIVEFQCALQRLRWWCTGLHCWGRDLRLSPLSGAAVCPLCALGASPASLPFFFAASAGEVSATGCDGGDSIPEVTVHAVTPVVKPFRAIGRLRTKPAGPPSRNTVTDATKMVG